MASDMKFNMKVCSNGHQNYDSNSEYDSEYETEYDSPDYTSEYDSDMSDGERYERYRANFQKFISWWKRNNKPKPEVIPKPDIVKPVVVTKTIAKVAAPKKEFSWGAVAQKEVPKIESIVLDEKKVGCDDEWTTVSYKKNSVDKVKEEKIDAQNRKTKMCESYRNHTVCRHGKNCRFAHTVEELQNPICSYGLGCSLVKPSSDICVYRNIHPRKICGRMHPNETDDTFYTRTTGIEKRATEEEIDAAYYDFLEELKKPEVSVPKKSFVKQQYNSPWPSSFEKFKDCDIDKLLYIARISNIQTHHQVKTNRSFKSVRKTDTMLFLDLMKLAEKRYKVDSDEITEFRTMLLKKQEKISVTLNKKKNVLKEDIKTMQIREKNTLSVEIRNINNSIEKNEKTIGRISNIKENKEFYKKQIEKISCLIKGDKEKLKVLEQRLSDFQDLKKFEEYLKSKEVKLEEKVEVVEQKKKQVVIPKVEDKDVVLILPKKVVVQEPVTKPEVVEQPVEDGWITVCTKKREKQVPTPTVAVSVHKRICESVMKNIPCRHGNKCRFSHEKQVQETAKIPEVRSWTNVVSKTSTPFKVQVPNKPLPVVSKPVVFNSENVKTKMCESVIKGVLCRHGKYCRFAHDKKELVRRKCRYGDQCYNIRTCEFAH